MKDYQKEFVQLFKNQCSVHAPWKVLNDFLTVSSCAFTPVFAKDNDHWDEADRILDSYGNSQEAERTFGQMLDCVVESLDANPRQDFLGEVYMQLGLGDEWKAQFFTPYPVAEMMVRETIRPDELQRKIDERGWIGVGDPSIGAGVTLIAARNVLQEYGIGGGQVLFVGQDIADTAVRMSHIQLSLLGCAGYVVRGDTLTNPVTFITDPLDPVQTDDQTFLWLTMTFYPPWNTRFACRQMDNLMKQQRLFPSEKDGQMTLF